MAQQGYTFNACIIFCGLPASGKSTLAAGLCKVLSGSDPFRPVQTMDIDLLRADLYRTGNVEQQFQPDLETTVRTAKIEAIVSTVSQGRTIIDDDMNYFRSMRKEIVDACVAARVHYGIIYVSTPLKTCLNWNKQRENKVPDDLIRKVAEKIDPPGSRAYQWDAPLVQVDLSRMRLDDAISKITKSLSTFSFLLEAKTSILHAIDDATSVIENPAFWNIALATAIVNDGLLVRDVKEVHETVDSSRESVFHEFDLATRRVIGDYIAQEGPLSTGTMKAIEAFKKGAIKRLRKDPTQVGPLLLELARRLRGE
jgi:tRNA uridine 5-carbamoylmethylation protein Kti12